MKKLFKWLLIITLALLVSLAIVVFNPGLIRAPLENYLSETAGYPVRLEGELKIRPGGVSTVSARNVHVSAPDWSREPDLLAIGHLELKLATATLLKDIIVIESLVVDGLELNLETDAEGRGNWLSAKKAPAEDTAGTGGVMVIFANVEASDAAFRFRNGPKDLEHVFNIVTLEHQHASDGLLHTSLNGDLNSRPVEYTSTIG
ncbi:MAG: AsmA family protein, partial [Xanthomonadales bacterium]|nr:AsmA family protein [Gammaproteobacteria bacterium]NNK03438.1 AsmA family protein [Xanthomonadales bacterium]